MSKMAVDNNGNSYAVATSSSQVKKLIKVSPTGVVTVLNNNFSISPSAIAVKPDGSKLYFIVWSSSCTYKLWNRHDYDYLQCRA
jgi:sugar lactone lactonase YvrE